VELEVRRLQPFENGLESGVRVIALTIALSTRWRGAG
jgi:hypothetical protein